MWFKSFSIGLFTVCVLVNSGLAMMMDLKVDADHLESDSTGFSSVLSEGAVLQQGPARASVYGSVSNRHLNSTLLVSVIGTEGGNGVTLYTVPAEIDVERHSWKAVLHASNQSGGSYNISLIDAENNIIFATIHDVTFGDVWVCAGQSNMALQLQYTFEGMEQLNKLKNGSLDNRLRMLDFVRTDDRQFSSHVPQFLTPNLPGSKRWLMASELATSENGLKFSALCLYFGLQLLERTGGHTPIGLIHGGIGGSRIEAWMPYETINKCNSTMINTPKPIVPNASLFNGIIEPLVNMTISGWIWYQGENNVENTPGSFLSRRGYGCEIIELINTWRQSWSIVPNTTSPQAAFGIVTLAAGTSEGHQESMASFRNAQLGANKLENVFFGHAYDLGDPSSQECRKNKCCPEPGSKQDFVPGPLCQPPKRWWFDSLDGDWYNSTLKFYMGPIHPRLKRRLGDRLALGALGFRNPFLKVCQKLNVTNTRLEFESSKPLYMRDEIRSIKVCSENVTVCSCRHWSYKRQADSSTTWFCGDDLDADMSLQFKESSSKPTWLSWRPSANPFDRFWHEPGDVIFSGERAIDVVQPGVLAIRFAWGESPCCESRAVVKGLGPCPPGNCGLFMSEFQLPVDPFMVTTDECSG